MPNPARQARQRRRALLRPGQVVLGAYLAAILAGTGLLLLPAASVPADGPSLIDAVFTSTAAVTLAGLSPVDTATFWTPFGQVVILALVKLGGIGIMTSASFLFLVVARRLGLRGRMATQAERLSGLGDIRRLLALVVAFSLAVEALATTVIALRLWSTTRDADTAWWEGLFHGVSAFNNAGFTLYSDGLEGFATDGWILLTVAVAVIIGGLGFPLWMEIIRRPRESGRWSLHTKLTLFTSAALLVVGTVAITAMEWTDEGTLGERSVPGRLLGGFFASTMARTAGFSTFDYADTGQDTQLVTEVLMLAGGGAGGTAGGLKVTTFALLFLIVWAELRGDRDVVAFRRTIPVPVQRQVLTLAVLALTAALIATLVLMETNGLALGPALFQSIAAVTLAGLSTGVVPELDTVGKAILLPLMLMGRVGLLTLGTALVLRERERLYAHPEERPLVG